MENKGRYRLIISLLIFLFMYILVLFVKQTDVIAVISNIFTGTMIEKSMPVYSYISNIDNNVETGVIGGIVNSIYPLNEYLMAAETSGINVTSETFDYKENETQSSEEEKKRRRVKVQQKTKNRAWKLRRRRMLFQEMLSTEMCIQRHSLAILIS